ncbi:aminoglycoside phosphotransferase [Pseudidiomarina salinarum]|uniref:Aminoglycoside phosphotransferase n=1 Tax=Pseudidiomarina salinarum TaxID=435908 RepID=A0A094LAZ3_9GAMM|nr:phosphotransferase family protein [Pseudidiomarina salinarum]KFZ32053.1 aminoglycoside phosphotransferase [Pseudidiomarina salinarum]RUO70167.1 phosphotransferase family protein [Pseudidiomarina salinarum]
MSTVTRLEDKAGEVREGEQLPERQLSSWLREQLPYLEGSMKVTQYAGGASNWTYRLEFDNADLILRRPPAGTKAKSAHDMGREFRLQQALKPVYPYVPQMHLYTDDESIIGAEFYIMDRVAGIIPRKNMPRALELSEGQTRELCRNALDCLIELHQVDIEAAGLTGLAKGEGYTQRQVTGWSERYGKAKTWNVPSGNGIISWLKDNMPAHETICMTHNDFRFDNLVLAPEEPTRIIGVLDWELATLGNPLMDLGNSLAYWIQADDDRIAQSTRRQPTHLKGMFTRAEVIDYYCEKMQVDVTDFKFYEVFGLFRLSVIAQQIYYRYYHKQTRNPAFKHFWFLVNYLHWRARKLIKQDHS